jgi:hypothetical protein
MASINEELKLGISSSEDEEDQLNNIMDTCSRTTFHLPKQKDNFFVEKGQSKK